MGYGRTPGKSLIRKEIRAIKAEEQEKKRRDCLIRLIGAHNYNRLNELYRQYSHNINKQHG